MDSSTSLYKYTDAIYADSFLEQGKIRIGTLYDYRRSELGAAIGDYNEGKKSLYERNPNGLLIMDSEAGQHSTQDYANSLGVPESCFRGSETIPIPSFMDDRIIRNGSNPGRVQFIIDGGGPLSAEFEDKDSYIFSCSSTFDRNAMLEFGYDACIVIHDPNEFFKRISKSIKRLGNFVLAKECVYSNRQLHHLAEHAHLRAALIKENQYEYQKEVRAIWDANHKMIKPRFLSLGSLTDICSIKSNPLIASYNKVFHEKDFDELIIEYFGSDASAKGFAGRTTLGTTYHKQEKTRSLDLYWDNELVISYKYDHMVHNGRVLTGQSATKDNQWLAHHYKRKSDA